MHHGAPGRRHGKTQESCRTIGGRRAATASPFEKCSAPLTPDPQWVHKRAMAKGSLAERGVLLVAALLLLAIFFSGYWIDEYVRPNGAPHAAIQWFLGAAGAIFLVGLIAIVLGARRR